MADEARTAIGRRAVLATAVGGAAALAAQAATGILPGAAQAANGDKVVVGQDNLGVSATWVTAPDASPALGGVSTSGDGLRGESTGPAKSGVYGTNEDAGGYGVFGRNLATDNTGALGAPGVGVEGRNGKSGTVGALGTDDSGVEGFHGQAGPSGALGSALAGVVATGTDQAPGLVVDGRVALKRSGVALVPKGKSSIRVTGLTIGPFGEVGLATLQAHRPGVAVAAMVISAGAGTVTIYLTKKVTADTRVAYFLLVPGPA
jgi:hypothetical protein